VIKHVDLYGAMDRPGYAETFALFERWMSDDVPWPGVMYHPVQSLFATNSAMPSLIPCRALALMLLRTDRPDDHRHPESLAVKRLGSPARRVVVPGVALELGAGLGLDRELRHI